QAHMRRADGRAGQRFETISLVSRAAGYLKSNQDPASHELATALRSELAGALALPDVRIKSRWPTRITNFENEFDFTPDLSRYLAGNPSGGMALYTTEGHKALWEIAGETNNPAVVMALAPKEDWAAARFQDGHVELHRIPGGEEARRWIGGKSPSHFVFSPDGRAFAITLDKDPRPEIEMITLPDLTLKRIPLEGAATAITFDLTGTKVAAAARQLAVWNLADEKQLWSLPLTHRASALAWSADSRWLAFALDRRTPNGSEALEAYPVAIVNALTGREPITFSQAASSVQRLAFDSVGETLAAASWDGQLVWGEVEHSGFRLRIDGMQRALKFSEDGRTLAYAPSREEFGILELRHPAVFHEWRARSPAEQDGFTLSVSSDGRWVATGGAERVRLWDAVRRREVASLPLATRAWYVEAFFGPADRFIYYSAVSFGVRRVELVEKKDADGSRSLSLGAEQQVGPSGFIATGFAADGRSLIVGENRRRAQNDLTPPTMWLWPEGDPARKRKLAEDFPLVGYRAVPGGRWGISADIVTPDLWIWNFATGERIRGLGIKTPVISELTLDGRWIITRTRDEFAVWEVGTWRKIAQWSDPGSEQSLPTLVASPDSKQIVTRTPDDRFVLRKLPGGDKVIELPPPHSLQAVTCGFSPDGTRLFVLQNSGQLCEWDLGALERELSKTGLIWH
ncbi:MAG TPA: WD40 repeat domain-containing protein, partial [Verrucomicrobiae bacterium]|nr:WD40 repeat domain-containing protein [Verrucomicrobiae bacterium]